MRQYWIVRVRFLGDIYTTGLITISTMRYFRRLVVLDDAVDTGLIPVDVDTGGLLPPGPERPPE